MQLSALHLIEKVLLLKKIPIFSQTPEHILAEVAHLLKEEYLPANTLIFEQGEVGNCMYIIFKGEVKIHAGKTHLATLKSHDLFGEFALLDMENRSASATTTTECLLFKLDHEPFYELMENRIEVAKGIIRNLCGRVRILNQQLGEAQKKN